MLSLGKRSQAKGGGEEMMAFFLQETRKKSPRKAGWPHFVASIDRAITESGTECSPDRRWTEEEKKAETDFFRRVREQRISASH